LDVVPAPEFASRLAIQRRTLGNWLKDGTVPPPIRIRGGHRTSNMLDRVMRAMNRY
jgi:hypothetical protein